MPTMMRTLTTWQNQYVDLMGRLEEPVVTFTGRAAESVAQYVPERPNWAFLAEVPTMTEFVDNQLKFRRRVVDEQAAFVRKMMKAMHPALMRLEAKAPVAKAPVAKAPPRKPARGATTRTTKARAMRAVPARAA